MERGYAKKTVSGILRFISMLFLIFEKGMCKKTVSGNFRFVSINIWKEDEQKSVQCILRFVSMPLI